MWRRWRKYLLLGVKKAKISLRSPKTVYPSIENVIWNKQKYTFGGQKPENKPAVPKNGIWALKSIDRKFYMKKKLGVKKPKISFKSSKTEVLSDWTKKSKWRLNPTRRRKHFLFFT
jgi:hypothetical protein